MVVVGGEGEGLQMSQANHLAATAVNLVRPHSPGGVDSSPPKWVKHNNGTQKNNRFRSGLYWSIVYCLLSTWLLPSFFFASDQDELA